MADPAPELAAGVALPVPAPGERWCVGAVILDASGRVFAQRRSPGRRLFPDTWDLVGGHVEEGESLLGALAREVAEETGWRLRRVVRSLGVWTWVGDDGLGLRHEVDFVVEVEGDLGRPALEWDRHPEYGWFGPAELHRLKEHKVSADQLVYRVAARALGAPELPPDAELLAALAGMDAAGRGWLAGPGGLDLALRDAPPGRPVPPAGPPFAGRADGTRYHLSGGAVLAVAADGRAALVADTLGEAVELALGLPHWWRAEGGAPPPGLPPVGWRGIVPAAPAILRARLADAVSRTTPELAAAVGGRAA
ncbi:MULTISPECIES: NUDIX hydrolase [Streptomyces]|uniref:NUDIX hydrolase n=1 Tax=Streptomyces TaxID=1883 RepID=UPI001D0399B6|nr:MULTISPECIES: NUDIX domain-containing protein [Streptomyces]